MDHRDILHHFPQALIRPSKDNLLIGSFSLGIAILSANPFHGTPEERERIEIFLSHMQRLLVIFSFHRVVSLRCPFGFGVTHAQTALILSTMIHIHIPFLICVHWGL